MQIFQKIAKLKEEDPSLGRLTDKKIRIGDVSRIPAVNVKIEKLVNRKRKLKSKNNKIGSSVFREFPDFPDIMKAFRSTNEEQNLGFSEEYLRLEGQIRYKVIAILKPMIYKYN